jgi:hypothetical protein
MEFRNVIVSLVAAVPRSRRLVVAYSATSVRRGS